MHCKTLLTGLLLSLALAACSQSGSDGAPRVIADNPPPPLNGGDGTVFDPPVGPTTTKSEPTSTQTPQGPGGPSGGGGGGTPGGGPVPEPGTILLVGSGLAGLALYRRRQRRRDPAQV